MNEILKRCQKIHNDLEIFLNAKDYENVSKYLTTLTDDGKSISELKSGLVITKAFKEHPVLKDSRKKLLELFEKKFGKSNTE